MRPVHDPIGFQTPPTGAHRRTFRPTGDEGDDVVFRLHAERASVRIERRLEHVGPTQTPTAAK